MNIIDLVNQDCSTVRKVSSSHGGEFSSSCPLCGGRDRFRIWPADKNGGGFWCRRCNEHGDLITYLMRIKGMKYREACRTAQVEPKNYKLLNWEPANVRSMSRRVEAGVRQDITKTAWSKYAGIMVAWAANILSGSPDVLRWLQEERFLREDTIKKHRLGWIPRDLFRNRATWGLPAEQNQKGGPKRLWIPKGLVIPSFNPDGQVCKIKIRRPDPSAQPRYYLLPGSEVEPMELEGGSGGVVVVESELDAILINECAGDLLGCVALGSASIRPGESLSAKIKKSKRVLVALDSDDGGGKNVPWWLSNFPNARRWPPVGGKDPGDMVKQGVSIRDWITIGMEDCHAHCG